MKTVFKNNNGLLIMENMESYLRQKMPDCCLYSDDGYKFMIHKVNIADLHHTKRSLTFYNSTRFILVTLFSYLPALRFLLYVLILLIFSLIDSIIQGLPLGFDII